MSDHITDPHASGQDHGLTSALHSPLAPAPAPKKAVDVPFTQEDVRRAAAAKAFAAYHAEHAAFGGASREFHMLAETWILDAASAIATLTARAEAAEAVAERWRAQTEQARAELERVTREVVAVIETIPGAVRVREGGGPEDPFASLAVSVFSLATRVREAEAKWASMVPAVLVALGGTDPNCVVPADVTAEEMAMHAGDVRRALEARVEEARADSSRLRAAVEEAREALKNWRALSVSNLLLSVDRLLTAALSPAPDVHPDDAAVDRFAVAMKAKMAASRAKGRGGWDDPAQCPPDHLAQLLIEHTRKGDPVDVGNLSMMLFCRPDAAGALTRVAALSPAPGEVEVPRGDMAGRALLAWLARYEAETKALPKGEPSPVRFQSLYNVRIEVVREARAAIDAAASAPTPPEEAGGEGRDPRAVEFDADAALRQHALLHPSGHCTCAGERECEWCREHCAGCGVLSPKDFCVDCSPAGFATPTPEKASEA